MSTYVIKKTVGGHDWEKTNLVTIFNKGKHYDTYRCRLCGIKAKSTGLSSVSIDGRTSFQAVHVCSGYKKPEIKKIKIKHCYANGKAFSNIIDNTVHEVIDPPAGQKDDLRGVWVMGFGEPVKVLNEEYNVITE